MRRMTIMLICIVVAATAAATGASAQQPSGRVVDRIVARIEGDIILLSQVHQLGAFQHLIEGRQESDDQLLTELTEQWVVETEATETHFPQPEQFEVDRELERLTGQFASPDAYAAELRKQGLSALEVRRTLARQIYVERYLDYKFRPSVQVSSADIETYYRNELLPELAKKNQAVPNRSEVEGQIRELLTQRGITDLAAKWLDETKSHLKIELSLSEAKP